MFNGNRKIVNEKQVAGNGNEPASIQGKTYDDVIGVQAKSHIKIDLHKNASRFQAQVGIADSHIDYTDKRDRKSTRLNSSHITRSRMPSSA